MSIPARAKRNPNIMPAGPPPAIQHLTETVSAPIATSMWWREDEAEKGYSFMGNATRGLGEGSPGSATG
jgi:hypothetical protein